MVRLTESFCCTKCFRYRSLKRYIREHGTANGGCDYCRGRNVHVIETGQLTDIFQNFMDLFVEEDRSLDTLVFYADEWGRIQRPPARREWPSAPVQRHRQRALGW